MMNLNRNTVEECEALFPDQAVITAIRENNNLDITIGDTAYENVEIHYHCLPIWESQSHPHDSTLMAQAFEVGDEVLVLCNDDGEPIYVTGLKENPRMCEPVIVMRKLVDGVYDYWHWIVTLGQGYHSNPGRAVPTTPEIVNKWWSCDGMDEVEYYTRSTPTLDVIDTQACNDSCGLINFDSGACCDAAEDEDNDSNEWYSCPCGGEGEDGGAYGTVCPETFDCTGGCDEETNTIYYPGVKSTGSYTSRQSTNCDQGESWGVSIAGLDEQIEIGPRSSMAGSESSDISTILNSTCSPIKSVKHVCAVVNEENCTCALPYNPPYAGYNCYGAPYCTAWIVDEEGVTPYRWRLQDYGQGTQYQGCVDYNRVTRTGSYTTLDSGIDTVIDSGEKNTIFEGLWNEQTFGGTGEEGDFEHGWTTECITCSDSGSLGDTQNRSSYAFTELSYGIAGWFTVVHDDGRFAVLIPKLSLSVSASSIAGSASGTISSTTTALLRIVDDSDHDYEIIDGDSDYVLTGVPSSRADIGIKPECYNARDIPLAITLRGFHWHDSFDWVFAAFDFDSEFQAALIREVDGSWQEEDMEDFKTFVEDNGLEEYTMYLA